MSVFNEIESQKECQMTPAETIALSKAITSKDAKKASSELEVGEHEVNFLVHITGGLKRGEDYNQRIVAKADPWTLLTAALSHLNGITVASLVREALAADPKLVDSIKKEAKDSIEKITKPTNTACNGKITHDIEVEDFVRP